MYSTIKKELVRLLKKIQKRRNDIMQMLKDGMSLDATNKSFADEFLVQDDKGGIPLNN